MSEHVSHYSLFRIRLFTVVISTLLSLYAVYFDDIINRDGIMYLQMVQAYLAGGLEATGVIFNWPAFPILIAWFHQLTQIPIETSAYLIIGVFFIVLTDTLVRINALLVNNQRQLFISALLILCFIAINEYRDFIMRDFGYWAFASLGLYYFMCFCRDERTVQALLWQLMMLVAVLFRIEGSILLLALPVFVFYQRTWRHGLSLFFQSISLLIIAVILGIVFLLSQNDIVSAFGKLASVTNYIDVDVVFQRLTASSDLIAEQVLNQFSEEYAALIFVSGLLAMMVFKMAKTFSLSYLIIYAVAGRKTPKAAGYQQRYFQHLLGYFFALNVLILTVFLINQYFLSSRYTVLALISLLLLLSYRISAGIEQFWLSKKILPLSLVFLALLYNVGDMMTMSTPKTYIKNTGLWAAEHLPDNSQVLTDDEFLLYYFERENKAVSPCVQTIYQPTEFVMEYRSKFEQPQCHDTTDSAPFAGYDYLLVVEKRRYDTYKAFIAQLNLELVYRQSSNKGDHASVYRLPKGE